MTNKCVFCARRDRALDHDHVVCREADIRWSRLVLVAHDVEGLDLFVLCVLDDLHVASSRNQAGWQAARAGCSLKKWGINKGDRIERNMPAAARHWLGAGSASMLQKHMPTYQRHPRLENPLAHAVNLTKKSHLAANIGVWAGLQQPITL